MNKKFAVIMIAIWGVIAVGLIGLLIFFMTHGQRFNPFDWNFNYSDSGSAVQLVNKSFASSGINEIKLDATYADVSFSQSKSDNIKVVATGNKNKKYTYSVSKKGSTLKITQKGNNWFSFFNFGRVNQRISITLPESYKNNLTLNDATGDISFDGNYTFKNAGIYNTTSDLTGGSIKADTLSIKTVTGDISLSKVDAKYDISVTTGDMKILSLNGFGSISAITGDTTANIGKLTGALNISVITGDATIGLSKNVSANISARATTGDINADNFAMQYSGRGRNNATAKVGKAPYNSIDASAVTGDMTFSQN